MAIYSHGVIAAIGRALRAATPQSNQLASLAFVYPSSLPAGAKDVLDFLGAVPAMRRWLGARNPSTPLQHEAALLLEKFESTIQLPLDWIDNDKTGLVQQRISQLTSRLLQLWGKLVADLINAAETDLAFTGSAFFAGSHTFGKSTIDNLIGASMAGAAPTPQEAAEGILAGWKAMAAFTDDQGEPCNEDLSSLAVVFAPTAADAYMQALSNDQLDTGAGTVDNPLRGLRGSVTLRAIMSPRLTTGVHCHLFRTDAGAAPLVIGSNAMSRKVTSKAEGSDFEHDNDAHEYGVKAVEGAAYGLITDACKVTFS
jgi:phage major head subunit gpT-like protein